MAESFLDMAIALKLFYQGRENCCYENRLYELLYEFEHGLFHHKNTNHQHIITLPNPNILLISLCSPLRWVYKTGVRNPGLQIRFADMRR
jgi:hypothetical protein